MRRITALWEAFYSKDLYREAFHLWKGIGFLTLLLLAFIQTAILFAKMQVGITGFVHDFAPPIVKQIPEITFKDGKAITPEAKAYEIKEPSSGTVIAIIDTRVPHPPNDMGGALIFLAEEDALMHQSDYENRSYDYTPLEGVIINETVINKWLAIANTWVAIFCAPFIFACLLLWRLFQLLLFSLVTLIAGNILGLSGDYAGKLRLTAMALVPAIILGSILSTLNITFFGFGLVFCLLVVGYIIFGVKAAREESTEVLPPVPE